MRMECFDSIEEMIAFGKERIELFAKENEDFAVVLQSYRDGKASMEDVFSAYVATGEYYHNSERYDFNRSTLTWTPVFNQDEKEA